MTDITERIHSYRESTRGLWNTFLRPSAGSDLSFDTVERFSHIAEEIFDELVLRPIGRDGFKPNQPREAYPFLRLIPVADPTPIMINRPTEQGMYWDDPIDYLKVDGLRLLFIECFDWDVLGFREMQYYRTRIMECKEHPHLTGRQALLDAHYVRVEAEEAS